jgi:catechol-2,3-dioxygenase
MLGTLDWLALEAKYLDRSRAFYEAFLDLDVRAETENTVTFAAGDSDFVLRTSSGVPRGGVHTHYAFAIPADEYDRWYDRLDDRFDLVEHSFGDSSSLYFYDPDGNCVELGQSAVQGPGVDGIFEVVLEVEQLDRAESFYQAVGFETVDRGEDRKRVRMTTGSLAIELWEPHLGLADARGGLHVDFGVEAEDPSGIAERVRDDALRVEAIDEGVRIRDQDGHYLSLCEA